MFSAVRVCISRFFLSNELFRKYFKISHFSGALICTQQFTYQACQCPHFGSEYPVSAFNRKSPRRILASPGLVVCLAFCFSFLSLIESQNLRTSSESRNQSRSRRIFRQSWSLHRPRPEQLLLNSHLIESVNETTYVFQRWRPWVVIWFQP